LTSLTQAEELAGRIDLKHLKLDVADLGALDLGTGPEVVAFVDPQCPHCAAFFKDLASLTDRYRFRLIPLPIAEDSQPGVLACTAWPRPTVPLPSRHCWNTAPTCRQRPAPADSRRRSAP
jgi:hypothetical protein